MKRYSIYADGLRTDSFRGTGKGGFPGEGLARELMEEKGVAALSDGQLLSVILNTGRERISGPVTEGLLDLLDRVPGVLPTERLAGLPGLGSAGAGVVSAMLEFGRRRWGNLGCTVKGPEEIFSVVRHNADRKQERFLSVSLNGAHELIAVRVLTVGLVNRTIIHPREVFADLIQDRAAAFAVAHNHPSCRLSPSADDDEVTGRLAKAAKILGINFLDHIIFSPTDFYSYRQNKKLGDGTAGKTKKREPPDFGETDEFRLELQALIGGLQSAEEDGIPGSLD
ncbi:MAG: DNA repair protein RadC [Treponema sp.]|nr:DNA repair protein RadC [Treponema sp.]